MQSLAAVMVGSALPLELLATDEVLQDPAGILVPAAGGKRGKDWRR
jgi:hypothetical protein